MNLFRTSLLVAIVSLLTLTGYAHALADQCCAESKLEEAGFGTNSQTGDCDCLCLCHQAQSPVEEVFRFEFAGFVTTPHITLVTTPPEVPPAGIEYPPRLA